MKRRMSSLFVATIIAMFTFTPAVFGQTCSVVVPDDNGVALSQITFLFHVSGIEPSATGEVDVNVPELIAKTGMSSGFINIVTSGTGWVVQNLPILPSYPYKDISTRFNLSVSPGTKVSSLIAAVCYSSGPLMDAPTGGTFLSYLVGSIGYNAQGRCPGDYKDTGCLITADPSPPAISIKFPGGLLYAAYQTFHENVQAADNQCVPAAVANNFTWLKTIYGTPIPDANDPGLRNIQKNEKGNIPLVGNLDMTMWSQDEIAGRYANVTDGSQGRVQGNAVDAYYQALGYMTYLQGHNILNLTLEHQGTSGQFTGANNYIFGKLTTTGQGAIVDPTYIIDQISGGSAVSGGIDYPGGGGHEVSIIGAGTILGAPFILYVSDHLQTPNDPTDTMGTGEIDASFLCQPNRGKDDPCMPDPTKASPVAEQESHGVLNDVMTQRP